MNNKLLVIVGATITSASIFSTAVFAASVGGTGKANVIAPMTIVKVQDLDFGDITENGSGGTVTLDEDTGNRTFTGGATVSTGGTDQFGQYTLGGVMNKTYSINIPATTLTGPGTAMGVVFTNNATLTLPAATETIEVGGTVTLGSSQTAGAYSGAYTITVDYN